MPLFSKIRAEHISPAISELSKRIETKLKQIEEDPRQPSWENLIETLMNIEEEFHQIWSPISHLHNVADHDEFRKSYQAILPTITTLSLRIQQSQILYKKCKDLSHSSESKNFREVQIRVLQARILDAELSGVHLPDAEQKALNAVITQLRELETEFSNHVLDASKAFQLVLKSPDDLTGLPQDYLERASQAFHNAFPDRKEEKFYLITLDGPSVIPFLEYSERRDLREKVYVAYVTRAFEGPFDNQKRIEQILSLRQDMAQALGYKNYAELSLAKKMVSKPDEVFAFLEELRLASWEKAKEELKELKEFSLRHGFQEDLQPYDTAYWVRRLQEQKFGFNSEDLKPYFPIEKVLQGLFSLIENLFSIQVRAADGEADVWHEDVRFFRFFEKGQSIAACYFDPYSRPENKKSGAWMDDCIQRRKKDGTLTLPVAHLVCNFTRPSQNTPSLLTFADVETLFHEFGHGLQHMLTRVDESAASGIQGIEWDAVELPSQFMEFWCYDRATLMGMTEHFQTKACLPEALYQNLQASKNYRAASQMLRQLQFALLDMNLHARFDPKTKESFWTVQQTVIKATSVLPPFARDRSLCSFNHIFAGGYAAGYYSYKWAEVLSADAFSAFEEAGLENRDQIFKLGKLFRDTILASGGGRHPALVFKDFRGRAPSTESLLKLSGLL